MSYGDNSTSGNLSFDDDRTTTISTQSSTAQFVPNQVGIGRRSDGKRSTLIKSRHVDASAEDLLHHQHHHQHQQQQQNAYPPINPHTHQPIRHTSNSRTTTITSNSPNNYNIRPPLIHGAPGSQNSSGHDSGLSSGGTSFDPEQQQHAYYLSNPMNSVRSTTPIVDTYDVPPAIPIPKRKSLPSIVKTVPGDYKIDETARSSDNLKEKETFIIENGIRKRVTAQPPTYTESGSIVPQATVMTSSSGSPVLARRVILESINKLDKPTTATPSTTANSQHTGGNKRGSMPTVVNIARHRQEAPSKTSKKSKNIIYRLQFFLICAGISREEASKLGSQRREELRRQRDYDSTAIGRVKALLQVFFHYIHFLHA